MLTVRDGIFRRNRGVRHVEAVRERPIPIVHRRRGGRDVTIPTVKAGMPYASLNPIAAPAFRKDTPIATVATWCVITGGLARCLGSVFGARVCAVDCQAGRSGPDYAGPISKIRIGVWTLRISSEGSVALGLEMPVLVESWKVIVGGPNVIVGRYATSSRDQQQEQTDDGRLAIDSHHHRRRLAICSANFGRNG